MKIQKKRLKLLLASLFCCGIFVFSSPIYGDETTVRSPEGVTVSGGNLSAEQIRTRYQDAQRIVDDFNGELYTTPERFEAPFQGSLLNNTIVGAVGERLNLYRDILGIDKVKVSTTQDISNVALVQHLYAMQKGVALLIAHNPSSPDDKSLGPFVKPEGMSQEFYDKYAVNSLRYHNTLAAAQLGKRTETYKSKVLGVIENWFNEGSGGPLVIGHRMVLIKPSAQSLEIGASSGPIKAVRDGKKVEFKAIQIAGQVGFNPRVQFNSDVYSFPSPGNFPNTAMTKKDGMWTFNFNHNTIEVTPELSIKITDEKSGKTYTETGFSERKEPGKLRKILNFGLRVEGSPSLGDTYGFDFGFNDIERYNGKYHVSISGIKKHGIPATVEYDVNFIDPLEGYKITPKPEPPKPQTDIKSMFISNLGELAVKPIYVGDNTPNWHQLTIMARLSNGNMKRLKLDEVDISGFDTNTPGIKRVQVTLKSNPKIKASVDLTVLEKQVTKIDVVSPPTNRQVRAGESVDLAGGRLKVYYSNGSTEEIPMDPSMFKTLELKNVGFENIEGNYKGKTFSFTIKVNPAPPKPTPPKEPNTGDGHGEGGHSPTKPVPTEPKDPPTGGHEGDKPTPTEPPTTGGHGEAPNPPTTGGHGETPNPPTTGGHGETPNPSATGGHGETPNPPTTGGHGETPNPPTTGGHGETPKPPATGGGSEAPKPPVTGGGSEAPKPPAGSGHGDVVKPPTEGDKDKPKQPEKNDSSDKATESNSTATKPSRRKNSIHKPNVEIKNPVVEEGSEKISKITRISGKTRIETAIEVSKKYYKNGAETVILVNGDKFSDILSAMPYSKVIKAPILYTNINKAPSDTLNEIKRLGAKNIVIIGGDNTVSKAQEKELKEMKYKVDVINGVDRYETSKMIADRIKSISKNKDVIVASGSSFSDALAISTLAIKNETPILLSRQNKLSEYTLAALKEYSKGKIYISGGEKSISNGIENTLSKYAKQGVKRLAGENRYETAVKIAQEVRPDSKVAVVVNGDDFADALVATPIIDANSAPILLVEKNKVTKSVSNYLEKSKITEGIVVGGEKSISDNTTKALGKL